MGTNLKSELEARIGCRVSVENDGNCAALAEHAAGALKGMDNAMVIVVGTRLGVTKPKLLLCERRNDANLVGAIAHHLQ